MSPVRGGARSGWVGRTKRINPLQIKHEDGHYTPDPTIYIQAAELREPDRLAIRVKDNQGRYWATIPESQGAPQGIHPFLLRLPPQITNVVAEVALLRPVQAEFMVDTRGIKKDE